MPIPGSDAEYHLLYELLYNLVFALLPHSCKPTTHSYWEKHTVSHTDHVWVLYIGPKTKEAEEMFSS